MPKTTMPPFLLEAGTSLVLMATPWWASLLHDISLFASAGASVCGFVVGIHAVIRLNKHKS